MKTSFRINKHINNGQFINDYLEIANGFNTFFSQVGPKLASGIPQSDTYFKDYLPNSNTETFVFSRISEIDILKICNKIKPKLSSGAESKKLLPQKIRKTLYYSLFDSHLNYGNLLWGCASKQLITKIENLQKRCVRNVALAKFKAHTEPIYKKLSILKFYDKLSYCRSVFMNQYRNSKLPDSFQNMFKDVTTTDNVQTRHKDYNFSNQPKFSPQVSY